MRAFLIFASVVTAMFCNVVFAEDENKEQEAGLYAQMQVVYHASANKDEKRSLFAKQLYVEKAVTDGWAAWGMVYSDQEYQGLYAGAVKNIGNWQLALGTGSAQYGGANHTIINPWVFYSDTEIEALATVDHYSNDSVAPWYYKGYVHKKIGENLFAGVYGEKDFGVGPLIDYNWAKGIKSWVAVPVAYQPASGRTKLLVGVSVEF